MYEEIFLQCINEDMSTGSVGMGSTSTDLTHTGDTYAPGDTRIPFAVGGRKYRKRKGKKGKRGRFVTKFPIARRAFPKM